MTETRAPYIVAKSPVLTVEVITDFNGYCEHRQITDDRDLFHAFIQGYVPVLALPISEWDGIYWDFLDWGREAIIQAQDAADERCTMADALV